MRSLIKFIFLALLTPRPVFSDSFISCHYGVKNDCPKNHYCVKFDKDKDVCQPFPEEVPVVSLPYGKDQKVKCSKAIVNSSNNSHAFWPSRFAVDLFAPKGLNASLFSVFDGIAYTHSSCKNRMPDCGHQYGNSVKIIGDNGFVAFYAHLKDVAVKSGQRVKTGQFIGTEGKTGSVGGIGVDSPDGFKHLHFSIHKYEKWGEKDLNEGFPGFASIPFKLKVSSGGEQKILDVRELECLYKGHQDVAEISSSW